jgi:hypothetical protein
VKTITWGVTVMNSTCIHYGGTRPKYIQRTGVTKYAPNPLYNGETTNIHIHLTKSLGGGVDGRTIQIG